MFISPCIGSILAAAVYMAMIHFDLPIWFFIFGSIESLFGSNAAFYAGASTYIADTIPVKTMAFRQAVIDAIALLTGGVSTLFVGYWIQAQGYFWPFVFVTCAKFIAMLYAIFIIPESLTSSPSDPKHETRVAWDDILSAVKLSLFDDGTGRRLKINILLLSCVSADLINTISVKTIFLMNTPLCWESVKIGYYQFAGFLVQASFMLLASFASGRWIPADWMVLTSRVSGIAENVFILFVTSSLMMYFSEWLETIVPCLKYAFDKHG